MCLTTLGGIGPPEVLAFIDAIFDASASRELAATGSTRTAMQRREAFYAAVHVALIAANALMLCKHTRSRPLHIQPSPAASRAADHALAELARLEAAAAANPPPPAREVALAALDAHSAAVTTAATAIVAAPVAS